MWLLNHASSQQRDIGVNYLYFTKYDSLKKNTEKGLRIIYQLWR